MMPKGPDYQHMENIIRGQMARLARDDLQDREVEFGKFIRFMEQMHSTCVCSLAGAVLHTSTLPAYEDKVPEMMKHVRKLVETADAEFSLTLRNMLANLIREQGWPDPFEDKNNAG